MADSRQYSAILMFGYPGCGKGTQGVVLGAMPNLVHLAMGDVFRGLDKQSEIGKEFLSYSTKGLLVPDELTVRVFRHHVDGLVEAGALRPEYHTLILDGIPRTTKQVVLLKDVVAVKKILHLKMDDKEALINRLSGRAAKQGRPDDADRDVILNRISVYEKETSPVLESYPADAILDINADQHPLAVLRDVAAALIDVVPAKI